MKELVELYSKTVIDAIRRVLEEEWDKIERGGREIARAAMENRVVHVIGAGHSAIVAEEMFYRAGGLANVNPIIDTDITVAHGAKKSTMMEHVEGYAKVLLKSAGVEPGDVVIVVSTSGVNTFPVEAAIVAKELGAFTIGITSISYSASLEPRNRYGKRLFEVVDLAIDNKVPRGDAVVEVGKGIKVAPLSTITNAFIVHSMVIVATKVMLEQGVMPAVWISSHLPEAAKHNEELFKRFGPRIKLL